MTFLKYLQDKNVLWYTKCVLFLRLMMQLCGNIVGKRRRTNTSVATTKEKPSHWVSIAGNTNITLSSSGRNQRTLRLIEGYEQEMRRQLWKYPHGTLVFVERWMFIMSFDYCASNDWNNLDFYKCKGCILTRFIGEQWTTVTWTFKVLSNQLPETK